MPGDASLIGSIGVLVIATRGQAGPGEVLLKIRGGTEAYIAWSAEPIARAGLFSSLNRAATATLTSASGAMLLTWKLTS